MTTARTSDAYSLNWLLLVIGAFVACRLTAILIFPVFDDAFITYRYAENLVNFGVYTYNPGEMVLGTTAPLFGLLLSFPSALGWDLAQLTPLLNILIDVFICLLTLQLLGPDHRRVGIIFVGLYAASPMIARIGVGGMESNLFLLVTLASLLLAERGRFYAAVIVSAISVFLRPEGAITNLIIVARAWLSKRSAATAIRMVLIGLVIGMIGFGLMLAVYHQPLPMSLLVKAKTNHMGVLNVLTQMLAADPLLALYLPFAAFGAVIAARRPGLPRMILIWTTLYLALYLIKGPKIWSWYSLPVNYATALFGAIGLWEIVRRLPRLMDRLTLGVTASLVTLACLTVWLGLYVALGRDQITPAIYHAMHRYCQASVPQDSLILASDIGAIGYYCPHARVIDLQGLVRADGRQAWAAVRNRYDYDFTLRIMTRESIARIENAPTMTPVAVFSIDDLKPDQVSSETLPTHWQQSYVLYRVRGS